MRSIILCGPNGSGKSTLAEALSKEFGLPIFHSGIAPKNQIDMVKCCIEQVDKLINGYIVDRVTPISQRVYNNELNENQAKFLELQLAVMLNFADIVYCTGRGVFTNKEYYPEGHYDEIFKKQELIRKRYEEVMTVIPHVRYDFNFNKIEDLIEVLR